MHTLFRIRPLYIGSMTTLCLLILTIDLNFSLGLSIGVFYMLPIFLAKRSPEVNGPIWTAWVCTGLIIIAHFYSSESAIIRQALANRALELFAIWMAAWFNTARDQAEEKLRRSHALFSRSEKMGKLGHWEWDSINKRMISCSTQFAKIYGMTVNEALVFFSNWDNEIQLIHIDDREHYLQQNQKSSELKKGLDIEYRIVTPTGDQRHIHQVCDIELNDEGKIVRSFGTVQDITERVKTKDVLQQSHALFSQAEQMCNMGHWEWDIIKGKMVSCSEQFAKIFGMSVSESLVYFVDAKHDEEIVHPDDRDLYRQHNRESMERQEGFDFEYRIVTKSGVVRHLHQFSTMVLNEHGQYIGTVGTVQDITERKLAEEEVRRNQALYRQAEQIGKMGHWEWDELADRMLTCSEQYAKIFGVTVEHMLNTAVSVQKEIIAVHEDDREHYKQVTQTADKNKEAWDVEYRTITSKGNEIYVHELGEPVFDQQGTLVRSFGTLQDITDRKRIEEQLSYQASHDALTGLINRREFEIRAQRLLSTIKRDQSEHALCFMDLDQFKIVNDTCGHIAGDEMLRQLSSLLTSTARHRDTVARLGGDEFGVLIEHCSLDDARRVANLLQKAVQDYQFTWQEHSFKVGVSIGLVAITQATTNLTDLLKQADAACYMAKDKGRNRIHVYDTEDIEIAQRHGEMQWVARINQALEEDRFCLYAQPIVALDGSTDIHYELLIRLVSRENKITLPDAFLPAAERYNLMPEIDRWVVEFAFKALKKHPAFVNQIQFISINLSGQSLADNGFLEYVTRQIEEQEIEGRKICFEITETAAISNLGRAMMFISTLKKLGYQFALDDFGSGLSSFAYLKNLSVDYLKIDGMFVKGIVDDPIDFAMVKSINEIGQTMGMQTIAEFVESDAIKEMLNEIGVNYVQGNCVGRPRPLEELLACDL